MACGFDPEGLRPTGWEAPYPTTTKPTMTGTNRVGSTATLVGPTARAAALVDARPQRITDPDWVRLQPRRRLSSWPRPACSPPSSSAVAGLVFVILMVLNQPVGTTRADALSFRDRLFRKAPQRP